jgi:hypothetical protein
MASVSRRDYCSAGSEPGPCRRSTLRPNVIRRFPGRVPFFFSLGDLSPRKRGTRRAGRTAFSEAREWRGGNNRTSEGIEEIDETLLPRLFPPVGIPERPAAAAAIRARKPVVADDRAGIPRRSRRSEKLRARSSPCLRPARSDVARWETCNLSPGEPTHERNCTGSADGPGVVQLGRA